MRATSKSVDLFLPATSANLGPAFDAAALAIKILLRVRARQANEFSIVASGRDSAICGAFDNHLVLNTYREVLAAHNRPVIPLSLRIQNQIPIGKGCGSSAAARLAGIALAVRFGDLKWKDNQIISEASRREHHPDNAAACWLGGLAVASVSAEGVARIANFAPKGKWPLLLAVPHDALSTEAARGVLPAQYSRADTVANVQNSMLLLAAFMQERPELIQSALDDRLHQPYRSSLCPLLAPLLELSGSRGVRGVCLSGAGPSVLIFLDPRVSLALVRKEVAGFLKKRQLSAELIPTTITATGGKASFRH